MAACQRRPDCRRYSSCPFQPCGCRRPWPCQAAGLPTKVVAHRDYPDRAAFDAALDEACARPASNFVCLAGFMRLLTAEFIDAWRDRMINIHPSLLPAFPGLDTHARALATGVKLAGCTVHYVRFETDTGPIIAQAAVPVVPDDDERAWPPGCWRPSIAYIHWLSLDRRRPGAGRGRAGFGRWPACRLSGVSQSGRLTPQPGWAKCGLRSKNHAAELSDGRR